MSKSDYIRNAFYVGVFIIALIALGFWIFRSAAVDDSNHAIQIQKLELSIAEGKKKINLLNQKVHTYYDSLEVTRLMIDSLQVTKTKVRVEYREIYLDIIHYSNSELDSVIRSNW